MMNEDIKKIDVVRVLLQKDSLFLHLDPRCKNVIVPSEFKNQSQLVLQIGYDMPIKIPDLSIKEGGIMATLSFNHTPFCCYVPWKPIFAVIGQDGRGMVWDQDMPSEVRLDIAKEEKKVDSAPEGGVPTGFVKDLKNCENPKIIMETPKEIKSPINKKQEIPEKIQESTKNTKSSIKLPPYLKIIK